MLKLQRFKPIVQHITIAQIKEAIRMCYNNISFSTFPYILYKLTSSEDALMQFNSGNCIALSLFLQKYLKNNYGVISYIVPASVPKIFRVEGTNHICHVSLCIPLNTTKYYIVDPAFYFLSPMECCLKNNVPNEIKSCNIHTNVNESITYVLQNCSYDLILPNSVECKCYFNHTPDDTWCYYFNEVLNPDEAIGSVFIKFKPNPFLCNTEYDDETDTVKKKYHLKMEEGKLCLIENGNEIFNGDANNLPKYINHIIQNELNKYFGSYIV